MRFEELLAKRYAALNFTAIHGYPNPLPIGSKWIDISPRI